MGGERSRLSRQAGPATAGRPDRWPLLIAGGSLATDCVLVLAKLVAGLLTGSLGLLSEAAHSALDLLASLFAVLALRAARKPADPEHPYGHGRAENLAAFGEGLVLLVTAAAIAVEGGRRLLGEAARVDPALYAMGLLVGTMVLEAGRAALLGWAGRTWQSPALGAAAQNRAGDVISSAGVLAGLIGVRLGYTWADAAAALLVAVVIARSAALLAWRSGDILIDRAPKGVEDSLRRTIEGVEGVRSVRQVRVRRSGGRMIGDATVSARPTLSVEGAQRLSERVLAAVGDSQPDLDLALVVESQSENLVERVHAAAARQGLVRDLHNVTVERELDGSLHVSMHAKLPGEMTLRDAIEASQELEREVRAEFPVVSRVDVHLEPLEPDLVPGTDVTVDRPDLADKIREVVATHPAVTGCPDVELSARGQGLVAHVVAQMPGSVRLEEAHRVETELEEELRRALPELAEVVARVVP